MIYKCTYFVEIRGKRISSTGWAVQEREDNFLIWDDKYGEWIIPKCDVILDYENSLRSA